MSLVRQLLDAITAVTVLSTGAVLFGVLDPSDAAATAARVPGRFGSILQGLIPAPIVPFEPVPLESLRPEKPKVAKTVRYALEDYGTIAKVFDHPPPPPPAPPPPPPEVKKEQEKEQTEQALEQAIALVAILCNRDNPADSVVIIEQRTGQGGQGLWHVGDSLTFLPQKPVIKAIQPDFVEFDVKGQVVKMTLEASKKVDSAASVPSRAGERGYPRPPLPGTPGSRSVSPSPETDDASEGDDENEATATAMPAANAPPSDGSLVKLDETRWRIRKDLLAQSSLARLATQVRTEPRVRNGITYGYTATDVQENSLAAQADLRKGDVILRINNLPLTGDAARLAAELQKLPEQKRFTVDIERGNQLIRRIFEVFE